MLIMIDPEMLSRETLLLLGKDYGIEGNLEAILNTLRDIDFQYSLS